MVCAMTSKAVRLGLGWGSLFNPPDYTDSSSDWWATGKKLRDTVTIRPGWHCRDLISA